MAEWIVGGEPEIDLWHMDIRRFGAQYRSPAYTHARIRETYETYYDIRYPNHEREAGRPLRVSPANAWHREHDAAFGEKSGWERVNWYESNAAAGDESLRPRGWAGQHWSPAIGAEHLATRETAAIFDESSFAKLEIDGPGRRRLRRAPLRQRGRPRASGRSPTRRCSTRRGGIECDFTVARLGEERFSIVTGTAFGNHDREWIRRHLPEDGSAAVRDVTSAWACFGDLGPEGARDPAAADPAGPRQRGLPLHERPRDHRRQRAGAGAAGHLRRRARLGALLPDRVRDRPLAGALGGGRAARHGRRRLPRDRLDAPREGLPRLGRRHHPRRDPVRGGRRLLREARQGGRVHRPRRAGRGEGGGAPDEALPASPSPTRARSRSATSRSGSGGEIAGRVTTGGYGYTVERSIAYAYVPPEHAEPGTAVEIEIFGEWIEGEVATEPLFDPKGERIRA